MKIFVTLNFEDFIQFKPGPNTCQEPELQIKEMASF